MTVFHRLDRFLFPSSLGKTVLKRLAQVSSHAQESAGTTARAYFALLEGEGCMVVLGDPAAGFQLDEPKA